MTREDRRSLAYHQAIADLLLENPGPVLDQASENLERWLRQNIHGRRLLQRWVEWLALPVTDLLTLMLAPGFEARDMRQVSPFAGVLSAAERTRILHRFQQQENRL